MGAQRITDALLSAVHRRGLGLIAYVMAGHPRPEATHVLLPALAEAGVDVLEVGVPFSDPVAEGPVIQQASFSALEKGITLLWCLETIRQVRRGGLETPILLMGYYNPLLAYGLERCVRDSAQAGVDGFIVADLPPEEAGPLREACQASRLALVPLVAPTSTDERIALACRGASGFVYCVSVTGTTGARDTLAPEIPSLVARVRRHTHLPVAVGFGVSRPEHLGALQGVADAVVVGSALVQALATAPPGREGPVAQEFIARLLTGITAPPLPRRPS
ncbi:Tryptophan synthase alpha chain [bacterium HR23]|nr:Tryptophan synthase alpha chain [bacterium HR23]